MAGKRRYTDEERRVKRLESKRKWRVKNRAKINAHAKAYYNANKDGILAKGRARYKAKKNALVVAVVQN